VPARLRDGDVIDSDITLTEQRVEEITGHAREVRNSTSFPEAEINLPRT